MQVLLLFAVFVVATCGLIYELIAGTLASYLLGDSVTQFSTVIGVYLFSMGIGSFFSKFFDRNLLFWFIQIEILVGLIGGITAASLFVLFNYVESFRIILYALVGITGILVGLEIPILMRVLKDKVEFKDLVSQIFTFDYIGALLASLIFPLVLVPYMGLIKTSFFFGMLNVAVALVLIAKFKREIISVALLRTWAVVVFGLLLVGFVFSERILSFSESMAYSDPVILSRSSHYQRIVLTKRKNDLRLFLNGNLQFSSSDEYRYHEALVHPAMVRAERIQHILVLGGGDGMAVREILKYQEVKSITLVDLDPEVTKLFRENHLLNDLNDSSLLHPKVNVINDDAFLWMKSNTALFDVIIVDFPDPSNYSIGKLYSTSFYKTLFPRLHPNGVAVVQSTSPYFAPKSYWCVNETMRECGFQTVPFHTYVPSFGEWGFLMAMKTEMPKRREYPSGLRFMSEDVFAQSKHFAPDMRANGVEINKLNNQVLVHYFEEEWAQFSGH